MAEFSNKNKQERLCALIWSLPFALAVSAALWMTNEFGWPSVPPIFLVAFLCAYVFSVSIIKATPILLKTDIKSKEGLKHPFAMSFIIIEATFLLALLSNYPGFCSTDSNDIVNQALGLSEYSNWHRYDGMSAHHPVIYTLALKFVILTTQGFGSIELSVFIFNQE